MLLLHDYLNQQQLFRNKQETFWVLGNESADADSVISSIIYAWYLTAHTGKPHVPIINTTRKNLHLRNEIMSLFQQTAINTTNLVFIDEIELSDIVSAGKKNIILVDHNRPSPAQQYITPSVSQVIDHHNKTEHIEDTEDVNADITIIKNTGSCATLVANELFTTHPELAYKTVAILLLAPILLDTVNLSEHTGRTDALDKKIAGQLLEISAIDRNSFYNSLLQAKRNIQQLPLDKILSMDYKEWHVPPFRYGISSVPVSIQGCFDKQNDFSDIAENFAANKGLFLYIIMHAIPEDSFHREMTIFTKDYGTIARLTDWLNAHDASLNMIPQYPGDSIPRFLNQHNTALSRKILQPFIEEFFMRLAAAPH